MQSIKNPLNLPFSCETAIYMYRALFRRIPPKGRTIFIACMPKSGSTFLRTALRDLTGYRDGNVTYAWERGEQDLYMPRLVDNLRHDSVVQQHVRATAPNLQLLQSFGIRPVILTRNLFDVVASVRDYLLREGHANCPALHATANFREMSEQDQLDFVIAFALPWYVQFYAGWYEAWRDGDLDMLWLRYEDLAEDWSAGVGRVLGFYGVDKSADQIDLAVHGAYGDEKAALRLNRGVAGLGRKRLNAAQCERIRALVRQYPEVDFSCVGVPASASSAPEPPAMTA